MRRPCTFDWPAMQSSGATSPPCPDGVLVGGWVSCMVEAADWAAMKLAISCQLTIVMMMMMMMKVKHVRKEDDSTALLRHLTMGVRLEVGCSPRVSVARHWKTIADLYVRGSAPGPSHYRYFDVDWYQLRHVLGLNAAIHRPGSHWEDSGGRSHHRNPRWVLYSCRPCRWAGVIARHFRARDARCGRGGGDCLSLRKTWGILGSGTSWSLCGWFRAGGDPWGTGTTGYSVESCICKVVRRSGVHGGYSMDSQYI
jgi:hypothetical protein